MTLRFEVTPKTQKGKNRVASWGSTWQEVLTRNLVSFDKRPGRWVLVQSLDHPEALCWVNRDGDDHFHLTEF